MVVIVPVFVPALHLSLRPEVSVERSSPLPLSLLYFLLCPCSCHDVSFILLIVSISPSFLNASGLVVHLRNSSLVAVAL